MIGCNTRAAAAAPSLFRIGKGKEMQNVKCKMQNQGAKERDHSKVVSNFLCGNNHLRVICPRTSTIKQAFT